MKYFLMLFLVFLLPKITLAVCNLNLAKAAGNYLYELEKAGLQSYQSGGACNVLDDQFKVCTDKQKLNLEKSINLPEILGNICMPHLAPPTKT